MKEEKTFSQMLSTIICGHLLLHLHFNLGRMDVLADWGGYLLLISALPPLAREEPSAMLLRPLGVGLAMWEGILWGLKLLGETPTLDVMGLAALVAEITALYFHFQLLTDVMIAAENHNFFPQAKRIGDLRITRTVSATVLALPVDWGEYLWAASALACVNFLVTIALILEIYSMKKEQDRTV
ncbi:MAG: hypothetical protein IJF36_05980 [Oscillibacter sp.]|nr:hypothetical protein [Oscillibacter sp.]